MFTLPPLPYSFNVLEPYIDVKTMEVHHDKHHKTYVDKLNAALEKYPELQKKKVEELLKNINSLPEEIRTAVKNHGGGHFNHSFWWPMLKKDVEFKGEITKSINKTFGSLGAFSEEFTKSALSLFGSGWTWLVLNKDRLEIMNTPNQDSPLSQGKIPILGIDMWEHSFYLKHGPDKVSYLKDFFHVINWVQVNENFKNVRK